MKDFCPLKHKQTFDIKQLLCSLALGEYCSNFNRATGSESKQDFVLSVSLL